MGSVVVTFSVSFPTKLSDAGLKHQAATKVEAKLRATNTGNQNKNPDFANIAVCVGNECKCLK